MTQEQNPGTGRTTSCPVPSGSRSGVPWICVYTKPQLEHQALWHLRNQGFPAYLPLHVERVARVEKIVPIFPRYMFAQPLDDGSWSPMRSTRGVASVLRTPSGEARCVPQVVIDTLLAACAPNLVIYHEEVVIKVNDALRVVSGPFSDLVGLCKRTIKDRIWLLLEVMGRPVEVSVSRDSVELVGA